MPKLIQYVTSDILDNFNTSISTFKPITGEVQFEDYINLNSLVAYLQNLNFVEFTQALQKPLVFGLPYKNKLPSVTLEISY